MTTKQAIPVVLDRVSDHTKVVRFNARELDAPVSTIYLANDAVAALGSPASIVITVAAAE
jgi:hypothetical protein